MLNNCVGSRSVPFHLLCANFRKTGFLEWLTIFLSILENL